MPVLWVRFVVALILVIFFGWLVNGWVPIPPRLRSIINVVLTVILVGMGLWLINNYIPMAPSIRAIVNIVVVVATCVGVLQAVGLWQELVRLWNDLTHRHATLS